MRDSTSAKRAAPALTAASTAASACWSRDSFSWLHQARYTRCQKKQKKNTHTLPEECMHLLPADEVGAKVPAMLLACSKRLVQARSSVGGRTLGCLKDKVDKVAISRKMRLLQWLELGCGCGCRMLWRMRNRTSDRSLRTSGRGLRTSDRGLRTGDRGLRQGHCRVLCLPVLKVNIAASIRRKKEQIKGA
jgi:hypothetical protein